MNRPTHYPAHGVNNPPQPYYQRQHTVRYYAHRVKESLTTRVSKFICTIFLLILFVVGLIAFIMWIALRPHRPRFYVQEFSIPALVHVQGQAQDMAAAGPGGGAVNFNVTLRNPNHKVIVHYDSIECGIYYRDQQLGGSPLVTEAFDQESKNTTILNSGFNGPTVTVNSQQQTEMQHDLTAGSIPFRLQITSVIKFHILSKDTRKHKMHANCLASVGPDGLLLPSLKNKRCPVYFT
ncbi:NDR1/HIN1-like protein 13 [Bienertia sinuspersici]